MKKKNDACVIKCIKTNCNRFGFGYFHKVGQYITYEGMGSDDINAAHVYGKSGDVDINDLTGNDMPFEDFDTDEWNKYYVVVPVKIIPRQVRIV